MLVTFYSLSRSVLLASRFYGMTSPEYVDFRPTPMPALFQLAYSLPGDVRSYWL